MPLLAIETSCDETSAAVVHDGVLLANVVSSQIQLHAEYGGVVPELAAREHLRQLRPILQAALNQAGVAPTSLTGVAVTRGPGLPGALLIGLKAAEAFGFALGIPVVGVHHHEAHLYSPWISGTPLRQEFDTIGPSIGLIVSGGHTLLVHIEEFGRHRVIGGTIDDAAGECFDKTAKMMGLAYPGGPVIDRLAAEGNPERLRFPRPMLNDEGHDFSFSGLKTSVRYRLRDEPDLTSTRSDIADVCASVQQAIVDVLVGKTLKAARRFGAQTVAIAGGVACNRQLRTAFTQECTRSGLGFRVASGLLCTDNAAMIGFLGEERWKRGWETPLTDDEPLPGWSLMDRKA